MAPRLPFTRSAVALAAVLLLAAGCGDDQNDPPPGGSLTCDPNFGQAQACGGPLSGTFTYRTACTSPAVFEGVRKLCGAATFSNIKSAPSGTLGFSGSSYALDINTTVSADVLIPRSCTLLIGDCDGLKRTVETLLKGSTMSCTQSGADCDCDLSYPLRAKSSGPVTTASGLATLSSRFKYYYCLKGDTLTYTNAPGSAGDDQLVYVLTR